MEPQTEPHEVNVRKRRLIILVAAVVAVIAAILILKACAVPERYNVGDSMIVLPKSYKVTAETNECLTAVKQDTVLTMTRAPMESALEGVQYDGIPDFWYIEREEIQSQIPLKGMASREISRESISMEDNGALYVCYEDMESVTHRSWWWIVEGDLFQLDLVGDDDEILPRIQQIQLVRRSGQASNQ